MNRISTHWVIALASLAAGGYPAALAASSAPAHGQGPYASIFSGGSFAEDADLTVDIPGVGSLSGNLAYDAGWLAGIAAGYRWQNGAALESEFTFTRNVLDRETSGAGSAPIDGALDSYALMINGYYRFDTASPLTPYIGLGAGAALMKIEASAGGSPPFQANDVQFAYQAIAGLSYALGAHTSLGVEYRYFGTTTPSFTDNSGGNSVTTQIGHHDQNALVKLTYRFR